MAVAAIFKIAFLAITHQPIVRFQRNFVWGSKTACRQSQELHDKNCIFKIQDGGRQAYWKLKIVKSPYLSEKSSDFDEIWYTTADIEPIRVTWPKIEIHKIQDGGRRHLENRFLTITHQPIVRFQQNFVRGSGTACRQRSRNKILKCKMVNGRHFKNC